MFADMKFHLQGSAVDGAMVFHILYYFLLKGIFRERVGAGSILRFLEMSMMINLFQQVLIAVELHEH